MNAMPYSIPDDALDFPEWVFRASPSDKQSLLDSLANDIFINDDAIPEWKDANGVWSSYIYVLPIDEKFVPVFRTQFNHIRNEAYDMIRARLKA